MARIGRGLRKHRSRSSRRHADVHALQKSKERD